MRLFRVLLAMVALGGTVYAAAPAAADTEGVVKDQVVLGVQRDGSVRVREAVLYDFGSGSDRGITRSFVTRVRFDDTLDQIFRIENLKATSPDGAPTNIATAADGTATKVTVGAGRRVSGRKQIVLEYTVKGVISPLSGSQELRWAAAGGWDVPVIDAHVTVTAAGPVRSVNCFAGDLASTLGCTTASRSHTGSSAEFVQQGLRARQFLTVVAGYSEGMTTGEPIFERRRTLASAFAVNWVTGGALLGLLVLMLGGVALLYHTRGRDHRVLTAKAAEGDHAPVDGARFAPPDGVRPGQIGTLIDEQADVIDVTATIVDLAVRRYLLIEELPRETYGRPDWRLRKLDRPDSDLLGYETSLYAALFDGRTEVSLSELGGEFADQLAAVRDALYDDVVEQGWFARRPDSVRSRWTTAGVVLTFAGVAATVVLAFFSSYALLGLAVIIAGAALALGGQYMPAKTANGSTVFAHTLGFRAYLQRGEQAADDGGEESGEESASDPGDAAGEDGEDGEDGTPSAERRRVALYSRYLPYAIVFDSIDRWSKTVADVGGENGEAADTLYWYEGPAEWHLANFADSIRTFTLTTSGAISASRQFRSLS
jgi:Predicted membrane protein (DUF2207)